MRCILVINIFSYCLIVHSLDTITLFNQLQMPSSIGLLYKIIELLYKAFLQSVYCLDVVTRLNYGDSRRYYDNLDSMLSLLA